MKIFAGLGQIGPGRPDYGFMRQPCRNGGAPHMGG